MISKLEMQVLKLAKMYKAMLSTMESNSEEFDSMANELTELYQMGFELRYGSVDGE